MKKVLYSIAVVAMVCLFASCGKEKKADAYSFQGLVLVPTELSGEAIAACHLDPKPVIIFDSVAMKFNGNTGCNQMFGDYTVENNNISFLNVGCTRMLCDSAANALEVKMLNVINNTDSFAATSETVSFYNDGQLLGIFKVKTKDCCAAHAEEAPAEEAVVEEEHTCQHATTAKATETEATTTEAAAVTPVKKAPVSEAAIKAAEKATDKNTLPATKPAVKSTTTTTSTPISVKEAEKTVTPKKATDTKIAQ